MRLILISTLFALSSYSVAAQELKPSANWRSPNIALSKYDRITIADNALQTAISMLNQTNGQFSDGRYDAAGAHYAQIAEFDRLMNQTTYKAALKQYFKLAESMKPGFLDIQNYGYAAARAYAVYQDSDFLDLAVTSWTSARRYTISPEQAATGIMESKQFTLVSSCNGTTLAGGTYFSTDPNDSNVDSLASGMFLVVSALLAEATFNQTYIDATIESANFIQSNLLTQSNIVWNSIESSSNQSSSCSLIPVVAPHGSGSFIEGLVILAGIPHNTSTESLLRSVISAVTTDLLWQGSDGVYYCHDSGGHYIVRGLASLYERNTTSSDLREYINEYIGVQYNAVIEQARSSNSSAIYGLPWTGPPGTSFDGVLQLSALTVLLGAIQLEDGASSVIPTSSMTASLPPQLTSTRPAVASSAKKHSAGIIACSVIGGIVLLAALIVGTLFLCKLRRQRNNSPLVVDGSSSTLTPFTTTQNMASSGILGGQLRRNQVKSARFTGVAMGGEPSSSRAADNGSVGIVGVNVPTEPMTSAGNHVASSENLLPGDRREQTLMEELLRSLNYRISRDRWNAEELPPDYHEGQAM